MDFFLKVDGILYITFKYEITTLMQVGIIFGVVPLG